MSLSETLTKLMKEKGNLTISDLSRLTKIPQPTLHHIFTGETQRPQKKSLEALAEFFAVTINQLMGKAAPIPSNIEEQSAVKIHTIPIVEWTALKNLDLSKINLNEPGIGKIITETSISNQSFALIATNKYEPLFPEGCILIFDSVRQPKNRDFVLVYIEENQDFLLRRIFIEGHIHYVRSPDSIVNDASLRKLNKNTDRVLGTLVESKIRF